MTHEKYATEAEVEIVDSENSWSPYLSLEDALKLDKARELIRSQDSKVDAMMRIMDKVEGREPMEHDKL